MSLTPSFLQVKTGGRIAAQQLTFLEYRAHWLPCPSRAFAVLCSNHG
jgi:hypothetical protein